MVTWEKYTGAMPWEVVYTDTGYTASSGELIISESDVELPSPTEGDIVMIRAFESGIDVIGTDGAEVAGFDNIEVSSDGFVKVVTDGTDWFVLDGDDWSSPTIGFG